MQSVKVIGGKTQGDRAAAVRYYTEHVATGDSTVAYYGGAPRWIGRAAPTGMVSTEQFSRLLVGQDPETGEVLYDPRFYARSDGAPEAAAVDLTFSAPKSVSALFALADPEMAAAIERCHDRAVEAAMRFVEDEVAHVRRGKGGTERIGVLGIQAAAVTHHTTRADDPQMHTHVVAALLARGIDGREPSMLDTRLLHAASRAGGSLYQAELRHQLTAELGVRWTATRNGAAEIEGVPKKLLAQFSKRSEQIAEELRRVGIEEGSTKARQLATLRSREKKSGRDVTDLREQWAAEARDLGIDPAQLTAGVVDRPPAQHVRSAGLREQLVGEALTTNQAHFGRRDVLYALAERVDASRSAADLLVELDQVMGDERLVQLTSEQRAGEWLTRAGGVRWTTADMLESERKVLGHLAEMRKQAGARCGTYRVRKAIADNTLNAGQEAAVRAICREGGQAVTCVGLAGSGKTYMMRVATDLLREDGRTVLGAATAGKAADGLMKEAGMDWAGSLAQLRHAIEQGGYAVKDGGDTTWHDLELDRATTLVVDEAAMTGTLDLLWVTEACRKAGTQLVLLGDPQQLQPVDAGGLAHDMRVDVELSETVRAKAGWERGAQLELRAGDAASAWETYRDQDRVELTTDRNEARAAVYHAWLADRDAGLDAVMIAYRRGDVLALNEAARAERIRRGDLHPKAEVRVTTDDGTWSMCRGDDVIMTRPVAGLRNGAPASVERCHADGSVTIRYSEGDDRDRLVRIDSDKVEAGAVALGYAITGHKAQGVTVDAAHVLADYAADRQWAYVAMSRGRHVNRMVFAGEVLDLTAEDAGGVQRTPEELAELHAEREWEEFVRSITKDGAEHSATSLMMMEPTLSARRTAETVVQRTGGDPEQVAWDITDRARRTASPASRERVHASHR